jgi:hypothetical protein
MTQYGDIARRGASGFLKYLARSPTAWREKNKIIRAALPRCKYFLTVAHDMRRVHRTDARNFFGAIKLIFGAIKLMNEFRVR